MTDELLFRLTVFVCVTGFFFLAVVAAGLWEKRPVQPYYVPEPGTEYGPSLEAAQAMLIAQELGFRHGGLCHDAKGRLYRVRYDFWIDPNDTIVAEIGSGTVASIILNGVWLYSRLEDGKFLCTTNEIGEQDISGILDQQTWPGLPFGALVAKHEQRLNGVVVEHFPLGAPLAGFFDMRRRTAHALVAMGFAYYLDDERMVWRYTLKGAMVFYFVGVWVRRVRRFLRSFGPMKE